MTILHWSWLFVQNRGWQIATNNIHKEEEHKEEERKKKAPMIMKEGKIYKNTPDDKRNRFDKESENES
jgi:hypothetical protein